MSDYATNCAAHARAHADAAEKLIDNSGVKGHNSIAERGREKLTMKATQATAHATLALYWQNEAGR